MICNNFLIAINIDCFLTGCILRRFFCFNSKSIDKIYYICIGIVRGHVRMNAETVAASHFLFNGEIKAVIMEIFKDISGYEGLYQVSNFGRVKSVQRTSPMPRNGKNCIRIRNEKILKLIINKAGYHQVSLCKNRTVKLRLVHQLVAESFLNHVSSGFNLVVNHKDFNRKNNHISNLEIVTMRENSNLKHIPHSSKYTGVCWLKRERKWRAAIWKDGKCYHIGSFANEYDAHLAYENELNKITTK